MPEAWSRRNSIGDAGLGPSPALNALSTVIGQGYSKAGRGRAVSAVERKPAQLVAQPLVVEHKFSDLVGELGALPLALQTAGLHAVVLRRCRSRGPDRVGRGAEFVGRHMAHRRS